MSHLQDGFFMTRRFLPLFLTQFLGAFNDNFYKNAVVILITYRLAERAGVNGQILVTAAAAIFMLPYLLFSGISGQLADKYDRATLARYIKMGEIGIVILASIGFYFQAMYFLLFVLFLLGAQSTFFGPIKYALLPQHLSDHELISGNAYINAGTFLSILLGTIAGGLIVLLEHGNMIMAVGMLLVAGGGYFASLRIPSAPGAMPDLSLRGNVFSRSWTMIQAQRQNKRVWFSIMGISWFWLLGATYLSQFPALAKDVLGADETVVTFFLTLFSLGIGIGAVLCSRVVKGEVSGRTVRWGALGLSVFTIDLFFAARQMPAAGQELLNVAAFLTYPTSWHVCADLLMVPVSAGFFIIPLYAIMQHESEEHSRARTIASNNIVNAVAMVASGLLIMAMLSAHMTIPQVFLTLGVANIAIVAWVWKFK